MTKRELIHLLEKCKKEKVLCFVDDLFMPIEEVIEQDGYILLKVRDIRIVEEKQEDGK